jgi:hypothetical protein
LDNTVAVSSDGLNWELHKAGDASLRLLGIGFANGLFFAQGLNRTLTSSDGITWSDRSPPAAATFNSVAYHNGTYVMVGSGVVVRSSNAVDWAEVPGVFSGGIDTIISTGTGFAAVGHGTSSSFAANVLLRSADGITWSEQVIPNPSSFWEGITSFANQFVIAAFDGSILTSGDGVHWIERTDPAQADLFSAASGATGLVAVGDAGTILASGDGQRWIPQASGTTSRLSGVSYGAGTWVAVGNDATNGVILSSPDAQRWFVQTNTSLAAFAGVARAPNLFAAVGGAHGQAAVWTSPDGTVWIPQPVATSSGMFGEGALTKVIYVPEFQTFVAMGPYSIVASTPLGWATISPQTFTPPPTASFSGLAYGKGKFVLAAGGLYTSTNLSNWTQVSDPSVSLGDITYAGNTFWALASDTQTFSWLLLRSVDSQAWSAPIPNLIDTSTGALTSLAIAGRGLLITGSGGVILQSGSFDSPPEFRPWEARFLPDGWFAFTLDAPPGATVSVDASSDLKTWSNLQSTPNWIGRGEIVDSAPKTTPGRFYRARTE